MTVKGKNPFRTSDALWEFLAAAGDDIKRGEHGKILQKIARQLDIPTDSTEARIALASCLLIAGQLDPAEEIAREMLAFEETAVSGHLMLAAILLERNEADEALAEARAAIAKAPYDIVTLAAAGDIMIGAGTFKEAEKTARQQDSPSCPSLRIPLPRSV